MYEGPQEICHLVCTGLDLDWPVCGDQERRTGTAVCSLQFSQEYLHASAAGRLGNLRCHSCLQLISLSKISTYNIITSAVP